MCTHAHTIHCIARTTFSHPFNGVLYQLASFIVILFCVTNEYIVITDIVNLKLKIEITLCTYDIQMFLS